jgi:hypothetical protein
MKRTLIILGVVLLLVGIAALVHPDFTYSKKEELLKVGAIEATVERRQSVQIPIGVAALVIIAGLGVAALGFQIKKK